MLGSTHGQPSLCGMLSGCWVAFDVCKCHRTSTQKPNFSLPKMAGCKVWWIWCKIIIPINSLQGLHNFCSTLLWLAYELHVCWLVRLRHCARQLRQTFTWAGLAQDRLHCAVTPTCVHRGYRQHIMYHCCHVSGNIFLVDWYLFFLCLWPW